MMIPVIFCCQMFGISLGHDTVKLDGPALFDTITREIDSRGMSEVEYRRKREAIRSAGGYSADAIKLYVDWLTAEYPPYHWTLLQHLLVFVQDAKGDRSAFRLPAVKLLKHEHLAVSRSAVSLLREIGTEDDAPAVASQLKWSNRTVDLDQSIIETLAAIGTEKEIEVLEAARKAGKLADYPRFWARVDECEKTIRDRVATKKAPKATPPEKK